MEHAKRISPKLIAAAVIAVATVAIVIVDQPQQADRNTPSAGYDTSPGRIPSPSPGGP